VPAIRDGPLDPSSIKERNWDTKAAGALIDGGRQKTSLLLTLRKKQGTYKILTQKPLQKKKEEVVTANFKNEMHK